jgi:integrase
MAHKCPQSADSGESGAASTGFTPHGLRRTCSTKLGEMLVPGRLIDRITNHKSTGITDRVYNKYDYLKEKQGAMNAWDARLAKIMSEKESTQV